MTGDGVRGVLRYRRDHREGRTMSEQPETLAEKLDAAQTGEQFGNAILGFLAAVDRERHGDE